jgi:hypothetical protein
LVHVLESDERLAALIIRILADILKIVWVMGLGMLAEYFFNNGYRFCSLASVFIGLLTGLMLQWLVPSAGTTYNIKAAQFIVHGKGNATDVFKQD